MNAINLLYNYISFCLFTDFKTETRNLIHDHLVQACWDL